MTIEEFFDRHKECEGRKWAIRTGCTTMAELWQINDMRPYWREWIATRHGILTDRELRLYACRCVRQVWHLLTDERSRISVEVAERYSDRLATDADLSAARAAARAAAGAAAWAAAGMAAWAAARAAWAAAEAEALEAARSAAWEAAEAAAWAAECKAEREAALAEALAAARAAQSKWLRENTKPNFKKGGGGE